MNPSRAQFLERLADSFTLAELELVCADLGVDAELIGGKDQGKAYWAANILIYFEQAGRVADLVAALREQRPLVIWAYALDETARSQKIIGDVVTIRGNVGDVRVEKSVLRIGTLVIPALPALIGLLVALALSAGAAYLALTPARMPEGVNKFNIAVADFGAVDATGKTTESPEGAWLSREVYTSLKSQLGELQRQAGHDFQITVWHDSDLLAKRTGIGLVRDGDGAAALADSIGAHVIVYGRLTGGAFEPRFYLRPAQGAWDEVAGPHDFGQALSVRGSPKQDFGFLGSLAARQRQLALFSVGLMYDSFGYSSDALNAFNQAAVETDSAGAVTDVLQYFIGREQSALGDLDAAELAFTRSINANSRYARAYTGLGSVNLHRAERLDLDGRLGQPDLLTRARDGYARAFALAEGEAAPIQPIAQVGLGYVARLEGDTLLQMSDRQIQAGARADDDLDSAIDRFDAAIRDLDAALPALERRKLFRLEAQAYLALGAAREQTATARRLLGQSAAGELARAAEAYAACAGQVERAPDDRYLRENTAALCARFRDRVSATAANR